MVRKDNPCLYIRTCRVGKCGKDHRDGSVVGKTLENQLAGMHTHMHKIRQDKMHLARKINAWGRKEPLS